MLWSWDLTQAGLRFSLDPDADEARFPVMTIPTLNCALAFPADTPVGHSKQKARIRNLDMLRLPRAAACPRLEQKLFGMERFVCSRRHTAAACTSISKNAATAELGDGSRWLCRPSPTADCGNPLGRRTGNGLFACQEKTDIARCSRHNSALLCNLKI
jgi:hypothetical protein